MARLCLYIAILGGTYDDDDDADVEDDDNTGWWYDDADADDVNLDLRPEESVLPPVGTPRVATNPELLSGLLNIKLKTISNSNISPSTTFVFDLIPH